MEDTILVIGANGQLGRTLCRSLINQFGHENVICSDIRLGDQDEGQRWIKLDATDFESLQRTIKEYGVTQIYHLAAILSAKGEKQPLVTWEINMKATLTVFEVARLSGIKKVFFPSSIAVYGLDGSEKNVSQQTDTTPTTTYGISKLSGEYWANYYYERYGLDVRSLRFPGVIGYDSLPGGGTTDYAVEMFHYAREGRAFDCYLNADSCLPMIYMEDALLATSKLMEAPKEAISIRTSYNIAGLSFDPQSLVEAIRVYYPNFDVSYNPDYRQDIAAKWPCNILDHEARKDWGWSPKYDLQKLVKEMFFQMNRIS